MVHLMTVETYVMCEKAAIAAGKKSVEEWLTFLLLQKVGNTFFYSKG
jgi:hypothetical protein